MVVYVLFTDDYRCLKFPASAYTLRGFKERLIFSTQVWLHDPRWYGHAYVIYFHINIYSRFLFRFYECMQVLSDKN